MEVIQHAMGQAIKHHCGGDRIVSLTWRPPCLLPVAIATLPIEPLAMAAPLDHL
jgi:hypothetical protein